MTAKGQATKDEASKLDFIKLKNFWDTTKWKDNSQNGSKYFANDISDKGLVLRIHKEYLLLNKRNSPIKKWAKDRSKSTHVQSINDKRGKNM